MKHTNNTNEQKSNSKNSIHSYTSAIQGKVMKRLLLLIISIFMVFAGAQSTSTTKANAPCDLVCSQYIDPNDGQCYIVCCPVDEQCKMPCERYACKN